jgi:hypothetical protein|tara:strand:- start:251 stop:655 length:405 start_codon:yes stop_codon:yes gene_type:complete
MLPSLIPSLIPVLGDVLDRFFPNKEEKAKAQRAIESRLTDHFAQIDLAQIQVNQQEAVHRNLFVAGWRPFIGWSCGLALFYTYLAQPVITFILVQQGQYIDLPPVDLGAMMPVLLGMLGLGGLRSWEKAKGITK